MFAGGKYSVFVLLLSEDLTMFFLAIFLAIYHCLVFASRDGDCVIACLGLERAKMAFWCGESCVFKGARRAAAAVGLTKRMVHAFASRMWPAATASLWLNGMAFPLVKMQGS